jgi:hypothetical protein
MHGSTMLAIPTRIPAYRDILDWYDFCSFVLEGKEGVPTLGACIYVDRKVSDLE